MKKKLIELMSPECALQVEFYKYVKNLPNINIHVC